MSLTLLAVYSAAVSAAAALIAAALLSSLFRSTGLLRPNFKNEQIPVGIGLAIPIAVAVGLLTMSFGSAGDIEAGAAALSLNNARYIIGNFFSAQGPGPFLWLVLGMSLLGFLDDVKGDASAKGFAGHFKALAGGRVTTGAIKALGGGALALIYVLVITEGTALGISDRSLIQLFLDAVIIAGMANMLNLFDMRPGRALKFFSSAIILLLLVGSVNLADWLATPTFVYILMIISLGAALGLLYGDLRARFMLGDAGSNALGAVLGASLAGRLPLVGQLILIGLIVGVHLYAEKRSITELIARNRMLRFIDEMGRAKS